MWVDPHEPGLYLGQCAQFCGPEHAKMLLRVYVDTPEQFEQWVADQQRAQESGTASPETQLTEPNAGNVTPVSYQPGNAPGPGSNGSPPNSPPTSGDIAQLATAASDDITPQQGRRVFEQQACINCHTISGTVANGRYGPDLTHL